MGQPHKFRIVDYHYYNVRATNDEIGVTFMPSSMIVCSFCCCSNKISDCTIALTLSKRLRFGHVTQSVARCSETKNANLARCVATLSKNS